MKSLQFLFFVLLATITYAQEKVEKDEKDRKFSISIEQVDYNQLVKENDNHLTNASAFSQILKVAFRFSEHTSIKTGFQYVGDVSFAGLTFNQYKIPLLLSRDISFNNTKKSNNTRFKVDLGLYLRSINGLQNDSAINYNKDTVLGFQGALNVEHDITKLLFVNLGFRANNDFSDLLASADSNIRINSYGFFFGVGIRL